MPSVPQIFIPASGALGRCWVVYELVDPRTNTVFYIGKTCAPVQRLSDHCTNPASAAFPRIQEIKAQGLEPTVKIIGKFSTENACLRYEAKMIVTTPGLTNRAYRVPEMHDQRAEQPPREDCVFAVFTPDPAGSDARAALFNGVIEVGAAKAIWQKVRQRDRPVLSAIFKTGRPIKRVRGLQIAWTFTGVDGKAHSCSTDTVVRLNRLRLIKSPNSREFTLTTLGKVAVQNARTRQARSKEIAHAA